LANIPFFFWRCASFSKALLGHKLFASSFQRRTNTGLFPLVFPDLTLICTASSVKVTSAHKRSEYLSKLCLFPLQSSLKRKQPQNATKEPAQRLNFVTLFPFFFLRNLLTFRRVLGSTAKVGGLPTLQVFPLLFFRPFRTAACSIPAPPQPPAKQG
jgi:hypothetical protein